MFALEYPEDENLGSAPSASLRYKQSSHPRSRASITFAPGSRSVRLRSEPVETLVFGLIDSGDLYAGHSLQSSLQHALKVEIVQAQSIAFVEKPEYTLAQVSRPIRRLANIS